MGAKFELTDNGAGFGSIKLNGEELEYVTGVSIVTKINCLPIVRVDFLATEVAVNLDDCRLDDGLVDVTTIADTDEFGNLTRKFARIP